MGLVEERETAARVGAEELRAEGEQVLAELAYAERVLERRVIACEELAETLAAPAAPAATGVHVGSRLMGQRIGWRHRAASMSGTCSSAQSRTARSGMSRERPSGVRAYSTRGGFSSYS